jgi:hypothetical protein
MTPTAKTLRPFAILALALACLGPASAASKPPVVAIGEMSNVGMDPRVDYLSGIIEGLLAFDLGSRNDLVLADRRNLDSVLREKELSLSALGQDADSAAAAGRLAGADWLLTGEYVFLGADVLVTLSLTDTATAKRVVFRDRGNGENLVHKLAEQVVLRLTGSLAVFADPASSRSLISLRDETPGSLALFSPIIRAEVFLDDQFVGYTTGDSTVPLVLDKLSPGKHKIRVHLDKSFGVIKLPEVSFHDWETAFDVQSDKRTTLRDETRQFNYTLSNLLRLGGDSAKARDSDSKPGEAPAKLAVAKEFSFKDRKGVDLLVSVSAKPRLEGDKLVLDFALSVGPKDSSGAKAPAASCSIAMGKSEEGEQEAKAEAGIVRLEASLERGSDYWSIDWSVERTDIWQEMFRD